MHDTHNFNDVKPRLRVGSAIQSDGNRRVRMRLGRNNCDPSPKAHAGKPKVGAEDARRMTRTTSHDCELEARFRAMETDAFSCVYGETTVLPQPIPDLRGVWDAGARQPKTKSQNRKNYPVQTKKPGVQTPLLLFKKRFFCFATSFGVGARLGPARDGGLGLAEGSQ